MKITGTARSTLAARCSSTADSAPKLDTMATSPATLSASTASRSRCVGLSPCAASSAAALAISRAGAASPNACSNGLGIERLPERGLAEPAHGLEERLARARAQPQIRVDDRLHRIDDLVGREALADDVADGAILVARAAEGDLVELLALALDAKDADVADVVMAAGVDAAGNLDLQVADLALAAEIGETLGDALRHRDRA